MKAEQIISTILFVIFRDNLIPIVWKSIVPVKAVKNLEESRPDFMKNLAQRERVLRETQIRSIHEVGELKRAQEMRIDEFSRDELGESRGYDTGAHFTDTGVERKNLLYG